jgi:hypothetical protein
MTTGKREEKDDWIARVKVELQPKLLADVRFKDGSKLTDRFLHEVDIWNRTGMFKPVIEIGNELAAAECLLGRLHSGDRLLYEQPMAGTKKRIDFLIISGSGKHAWVEVKTVAPEWVNDEAGWQRYMRIAKDFTNAQLIVDREFEGAAIAGQAIKARWSFIQQTVEVEARAALIPDGLKGPVSLLFCSTGFDWHRDELEDFADYYRAGKPRTDDPLSNATDRYMRDDGLSFSRSLSGFHYLGRKRKEASAHCFTLNVAGPSFGA